MKTVNQLLSKTLQYHQCRQYFWSSTIRNTGKSSEKNPIQVEKKYFLNPRDFNEIHKFITLTVDVMFVKGIAFLTTLSRDIRLFASGQFPYNTDKQLSSSLIKVTKYS